MFGLKSLKKEPVPTPFEQGYAEAMNLSTNVELPRRRGREVLEHMGILPSEMISDMYDIWNPAADRTTEVRFGGSHEDFYAFYDGAEAALAALTEERGAVA